MQNKVIENYLNDVTASFLNYKKMAEKAIDQVSVGDFFRTLDDESNSIGIIVKHMAGNARSRWTDFLTTDGEKPDRFRDTEFELIAETRSDLMKHWNTGWETVFSTLLSLEVSDFSRTVTIRGESHTIVEAINRQNTHFAYHVGQIAFLAKHFCGKDWKTLSVPRNKSDEFNEYLAARKNKGKTNVHALEGAMAFLNDKEE